MPTVFVDSDHLNAFLPNEGGASFGTTLWSIVFQAGDDQSPEAERALGKLYKSYAYPLYSFVRRHGYAPEAAQDLVQDIFLELLEKKQLASVSPHKGRFRSYLMAAANHRMLNQWRRRRRLRHGGGQTPLEFDALAAEERYRIEPAEGRTPDVLFERRWAVALLDGVFSRLRAEWIAAGKGSVFETLRLFLSGDSDHSGYAAAGQALGMSEGAARVAVHRLRQRYRDLLRDEIAQTVADPNQIHDELRHLLAVLRG